MFSVRAPISLSELLAEVDRLERELKDLGRELQRGGDFVRQLEEIVERDTKRVGEAERDTSKISREILEWEERERFLAEALTSGGQSSQLLVQMETQARSKLDEERKVTSKLMEDLEARVVKFADQVVKEEEEYRKFPEYLKILYLEELIKKKAEMVELQEREVGQMAGDEQMWVKEVKEDKVAYTVFKTTCITLAEQWLEFMKQKENLNMMEIEKTQLMQQIERLGTERIIQKKAASTKPSQQDPFFCRPPDDKHTPTPGQAESSQIPSFLPPCVENTPLFSSFLTPLPSVNHPTKKHITCDTQPAIPPSSVYSLSLQSLPHSSPVKTDPLLSTSLPPPAILPHQTKVTDTNSLMDNITPPISSSSSLASLLSVTPQLTAQPAFSYIPATPRTKKLHLKLGTSLLARKKKVPTPCTFLSPASADNFQRNISPSLPTFPAPITTQYHSLLPVKMKSFKFGLPSLLGKKSAEPPAAQHSPLNEETLARNPTLPINVDDVEDMEVEGERIEIEGDEDVVNLAKNGNWSRYSHPLQPSDTAVPSTPMLSPQAVTETADLPIDQLSSTPTTDRRQLLSVRPGTALSDQKRTNLLNQVMESPLSVASRMLSSAQVEASSILTADVCTKMSPTTPLSTKRRQLLSVSPGTALSDKKRKAVLQQLLDSPQPVLHTRQAGKDEESVLDVNREKVERLVTNATSSTGNKNNEGAGENIKHGNVSEINFGEENHSGFSFDRNAGEADTRFSFGGGENKGFNFGVEDETREDFSFFGGEKIGDENDGEENAFSFSFAGSSYDEENKGEGAGGGFSFF